MTPSKMSSRKLKRAVLTGSILAAAAIVVPDAHAQFYVQQFNGLTGGDYTTGENSNRTLGHAGAALYNQADFIDDKDMVMAVELNGDAVAYPVLQMAYHHIVNDVVGGRPITATY